MDVFEFFEWIFEPIKKEFPDYSNMLLTEKLSGNAKGLLSGTHVSPFDQVAIKTAIDKANAEQNNLYFSCAVAMEEHADREGVLHYKKTDITGSTIVWVEIDGERTEEELNAIRGGDFAPTILIRSGNGYHLYWLLNSFVRDENSKLERINRGLIQRFDGDGSCFDINRILRVPGTFNTKDPANPKPVEILWYNHDVGGAPIRYDVDAFPLAEEAYDYSADTGEILGVTLGDDFLKDARFNSAKWLLDAMFERLPAPAPGQPGRRSQRDFRVADKMSQIGFTKEEIFSCLTHPSWPIGDKGREQRSYAKKTASKVAAKNSDDKFDTCLALLDEAFSAEEEKKLTESIPSINRGKLRKKIKSIFYDVLQPGGPGRHDRDSPKFGAIFGEEVAVAINEAGYRYVFDPEFDKSFISDRRGTVWEAAEGGAEFGNFISSISGFSNNQEEFRFISKGVINYIENCGEQIRIGRWVHYDQPDKKFYILADNKKGKIYSIDQHGKIEELWNGSGDVFLRPRIQASKPLTLTEDVELCDAVNKLEDLFTKFIAGPPDTKRFITALLIAITVAYGSEIVDTLPIIHLTGPSGGGKSATTKCMTNYLFGYSQVLLYTTAAAYRAAPGEIFMAHDDKEDISKEMEHFFLLSSTRAERSMCNLNSQVDIVTQRAHVVNCITSIDQLQTTALRRRTLVIEINKDHYPSADELMEGDAKDIANNRDFIWSGMTKLFAEVIKAYSDGRYRALCRKVYQYIEEGTFKGLASFIALMILVEEQLAKATGRIYDEDVTMQQFVATAGLDDKYEIVNRDPMVLCLDSFFEKFFTQHVSIIGHTGTPEENVEANFTTGDTRSSQPILTSEEENDSIRKLIGSRVRGVKASSTGWVSIFATDAREFAQTIKSPTSLGKQFSRVEGKVDFPFYITSKRVNNTKIWSVFQKIE